jgi:hypothetical protein
VAGRTAEREGEVMTCEDAAKFTSALCDGEKIPRDAAEHIGTCDACLARLSDYMRIGAELRRVASLEHPIATTEGLWRSERRIQQRWWQKGGATMRIPRLAFASMLGLILLLSSGLVLVRARTSVGGPVLVLTSKLLPDGPAGDCIITTDRNPRTNNCDYTATVGDSSLGLEFRFVNKEGDRAQLGVKVRYKRHSNESSFTGDLNDVPEQLVWVEPKEKRQISVSDLGEIELTADYLDHMPSLRFRPKEPLDPQKNEFRIVSPVLVRGKEVLFNLAGSDSTDSGDPEAALMIYYPGEGRYLISTVPFKEAVQGSVEPGQIKFNLQGQDYLLLTAMPVTRSEHVWVSHDPQYKLSQHMPGASDDHPMFMVRRLDKLLQERIHHVM